MTRFPVRRIKYGYTNLDHLRVPLNATERAEIPGTVPYWGANSIQDYVDRAIVDGPLVLIGEDGAPFFDKGKSVAFASTEPIWPNNHIHVLRPLSCADYRFGAYALNSVDYSLYIKGSTRDKLNQSDLMSIEIPFPSLEEQRAIADFLDRETAEIDAFIADQERLIELLNERRTATITHAVMGYFMPDSYPSRLGHYLYETDERRGNMDLPLYSVSINLGVVPWSTLFDKLPRADDLSHYRFARRGDLVLNRMRAFQGGVGVATEDCCVSPDYAVLRTRMALPELIERVLRSETGLHEIRKRLRGIGDESSGAVRTPRINVKDLLDIRVKLPDLGEQLKNVDVQEAELGEIDELIADAQRAIELSKERRAALISAAVTGQIDVRAHS